MSGILACPGWVPRPPWGRPMNRTSAPLQAVANVDLRSEANTRLRGSWLIVARTGWLACVGLTLMVFFASLPVYSAQLQTICSGTTCAYRQLSPEQATALRALGFSLEGYAAYTVALSIIAEVVCVAVSSLIFWRKSSDWMALLFGLCLVLGGTAFVSETVEASHSLWSVPALLLNECTFVLLYFIASLFPDGRFVPLSVGVAILRYRLWDIDILINRTLVYGSLSTLLALLYFGSVFGLQALFHDLTELGEQLVAAVHETMQPSHVSLWLRQPEHQTHEHLKHREPG